jgi:hypothetical protein
MKITSLFLLIFFIFHAFSLAAICPQGDLNGDCRVFWEDIIAFSGQWLDAGECEGEPVCANFDGLSGINLGDFEILASHWLEGVPLVINEFMASNSRSSGIKDPQNEYDDWIEIYNFGSAPINLAGMYLTDDLANSTKWQIPSGYPAQTTIPAGGFVVFWADEDTQDGPLHANFKLSAGGEALGLYDSDGSTAIDTLTFGTQTTNIAYGRDPNGIDNWRFFPTPTPGAVNNGAYLGEIDAVEFSHTRGFYNAPFNLSIACATPGVSIYYTTDGKNPIDGETAAAGAASYTGSLAVSGTKYVRAAAIKSGWRPSPTKTHTFIFGASNVIQSMPVVSLVGDAETALYEPNGIMAIVGGYRVSDGAWQSGGIGTYNNPMQRGIAYERPVSFEIINLPAGDDYQQDCGIRVHGSDYMRPRYTRGDDWSCNFSKFSFNLFFRSDYGNNRFDYPFFGAVKVDRYQSIVLRAGHNDNCSPFVKDEWTRRLFCEMGWPQVTGTFVNLYINGGYKYYYNPCERDDAKFFQEWYDTENAFDVITQGDAQRGGVRDGDAVAWNDLVNYVNSHDLFISSNYNTVAGKMDITNFIDLLTLQVHIGNFDWPGNNWTVHREKSDAGLFRFTVWDAEGTAETGEYGNTCEYCYKTAFENFPSWSNPTGLNHLLWDPISQIYRALKVNPNFRLLFADRIHKHYRNGGVLMLPHLIDRWWEVYGEISDVLPWQNPYVPIVFLPQREPYAMAAFEANGLFNRSLEAPSFNINGSYQHGGYISAGSALAMTNPSGTGTIYYTTNGSDPRQTPADSDLGPEFVLAAENAAKQVLIPTGTIRAADGTVRAETWTRIEGYAVSDLTSKPAYPNSPDKVEFWNSFQMPTIDAVDMYGTRVRALLYPPTTGSYTFWIASDDNGQLKMSTDISPANAAIIAQVSSWTPQNQWNNNAEQQSAARTLQAGSAYYIEALQKEHGGGDNLSIAWSGPGISQQVIPGTYLSIPDNGWASKNYTPTGWISGSGAVGYERNPGDAVNYSSYINSGINVNTQMYSINTSCYIRIPFQYSGQAFMKLTLRMRYDDGFVAFINGQEVARAYVNTTLPLAWNTNALPGRADGQVLTPTDFDISAFIPQLQSGTNILAIQGLNEPQTSSDFLVTASLIGKMRSPGMPSADATAYTASVALTKNTQVKARVFTGTEWSALNDAVFAPASVKDSLRVTELMYHSSDPNTEYIEIKNISTGEVNLNLVKFTQGINYTFGNTTLAAGRYILVVENLAAFQAKYGTGLNVAGQYTGFLDNAGERIRLEDAIGNAILDFDYKDGWRSIADGDGYSLTLINPANADTNSWGYKDSWRASAYVGGSPGSDDSGIIPNPGSIVINEVLSHSHSTAADWIELYNTTSSPINIGGWYLSDSQTNPLKYRFAADTTIAGHGYLVVNEIANFGPLAADPGRLIPFALSENGEQVCLASDLDPNGVLTGYREKEDFGASETWVSFGRYHKGSTNTYNFVPMSQNTPGMANSYPKVGPIVISEIMYHPDWPTGGVYVNEEYEYVELTNISASEVTLYDSTVNEPWQFTDGIQYTFAGTPNTVKIPAGGRILVVKNPTAFRWRYPAVPVGIIYGPYSGKLANEGEQLEISKPGDVDEFGVRQYIRVDRVTYSDGAHPGTDPVEPDLWPTAADGNGKSLGRINAALYGNDPNNWRAIPEV